MKIATALFVLILLTLTNLSGQALTHNFQTYDKTLALNRTDTTTTTSTTDSISTIGKTDQIKRFKLNLYLGLGGRVPMNDSYYNLWKDLAIGDVQYKASDNLGKAIAANWSDYFFTYLRADFDVSISKNLSIGLVAFPDKYKKTLKFSDKTNNWTGNGSNGLEDHWELNRKLRIATYNFGPDIKLKAPIKDWELSLSYLYGWSYLWRSSYEFSYYSQLTGTGETGFLGLLYTSDGNLTKLRFNGNDNFHRIELAITRFRPDKSGGSVALKIGYHLLKMDNIRYKVLKYDPEVINEAMLYFDLGEYREYEIGDSGDVYIDNEKFILDISAFYISLDVSLFNKKK